MDPGNACEPFRVMDESDDGSENCVRIDDLQVGGVGWWKRLDLRIVMEHLRQDTSLKKLVIIKATAQDTLVHHSFLTTVD
jgi:hypothetical protein